MLYKTYQVNNIQLCAESLNIDFLDNKGKSLKKLNIIKRIVVKIMSMLPMYCSACEETYKLEIDETPFVSCFLCERPSHNCASFEEIKSSLSTFEHLGFRYMCIDCRDSTSSVLQSEIPEEQAKVDESIPEEITSSKSDNVPQKRTIPSNHPLTRVSHLPKIPQYVSTTKKGNVPMA